MTSKIVSLIKETAREKNLCTFEYIMSESYLIKENTNTDEKIKKPTSLSSSQEHFDKYVVPKIPSNIDKHDYDDPSNHMILKKHVYAATEGVPREHKLDSDHNGFSEGTAVVPISKKRIETGIRNTKGKTTKATAPHVLVHIPETGERAWIPQTSLSKPKEKTKYNDESALIKMWNYATKRHQEQKAAKVETSHSKGYVGHATDLVRDVEDAAKDPTHPLSFENAHPNEFEGGNKDNKFAKRSYYTYMRSAAIGTARIASDPEHTHRFTEGHEMIRSGSKFAKLSKLWKKWGATGAAGTYKGDAIMIRNPKNKKSKDNKDTVSFSLKDAKSAQISSGSHAEAAALFDYAHRQAVRRGKITQQHYDNRSLPTIWKFKDAIENGKKQEAEKHLHNLLNYPDAPKDEKGNLIPHNNTIFHNMVKSSFTGSGKMARPSSVKGTDVMSEIEGHATHLLSLPHMNMDSVNPKPLDNELDRCTVKPLFGKPSTISEKLKAGTISFPTITKPKHKGKKTLTMRISEATPQSKIKGKLGNVPIEPESVKIK
jgi:hypothetical protein